MVPPLCIWKILECQRDQPQCHVVVLLFLLLIHSGSKEAFAASCSSPLGLTSGDVLDWQLSASSSYPTSWDSGCHVKFARLHQPNGKAWCSGNKAAGEWLLVDLGVPAKVTGLVTQGKADGEEWVTKYQISHSLDAYNWYYVKDLYGDKKMFQGNINSHEPRANVIEPSISARFVRVHVVEWHTHPSVRLELLGCQECKTYISEGIQVRTSASSYPPWNKKKSCQPYDAAINSERGWCAKKKSPNQWLQFDLGPPHTVMGVVTKGRGDSKRKDWVRSYSITYSNDSKIWFTYKDGNHLDTKVFGGNLDKQTERRHYLNSPFTARFVRVHPVRWHRSIAMRVALMGCPHSGKCGKGFFRITPDSPCMENLAFGKKTWVNDERHQWADWNRNQGVLAVDGSQDRNLSSCAVVENFKNDEPVWMVDLERKKTVTGVVLVTWQGQGEDEITIYRDFVFGLEKLTIYVEQKPRQTRLEPKGHNECATVTRRGNAVFREKIHLECPHPIEGRYLYAVATGVPNRWHRIFSLALCEIMVY